MSAYEVSIKITPICTSCGGELEVGVTQSRATGHPFERDNPCERTDRRVFIAACEKCFVHRNDRKAIAEIHAQHQAGKAA